MVRPSKKNFAITDGKGFHMTFANGYTISVQWGRGNYCDNYDMLGSSSLSLVDFGYEQMEAGKTGSNTAECAVLNPEGDLIELPTWAARNDQVTNRSTPEEVLKLMKWAASQKG